MATTAPREHTTIVLYRKCKLPKEVNVLKTNYGMRLAYRGKQFVLRVFIWQISLGHS